MDALLSSGPIIACSTSNATNAAISLIRISGFEDLSIFDPYLSIDIKKIVPRYAHFCNILSSSKEVLDEVVLTFYKAPNSYNGENILELAVHGNILNVDRITRELSSELNISLAKPGEFSLRAYLNKKLSLSQIEGLDLLLNAKSEYSLKHGLSILNGKLHKIYNDLYEKLLDLKSSVELSIDFLEDIGEQQAEELFEARFSNFYNLIKNLNEKCLNNDQNFLNPKIGIFGPPNAGKSTLFNNILEQDRSIVTNLPGTTRDFISESVKLNGLSFQMIDTAGVRESSNIIEKEGINRSKKLVDECFFKILLINSTEEFSEANFFEKFDFDYIIFTHASKLNSEVHFSKYLFRLNFKKIILAEQLDDIGPIGPTSVFENFGPIGPKLFKNGPIGPIELRKTVLDSISRKYDELTKNDPMLIERHKLLILQCFKQVLSLKEFIKYERDIAIISHKIEEIAHSTEELIGLVTPDDVLNNIFSNFCIGK